MPPRRRPAFTLMEVVLSLALFALIAIALLDAVAQVQQAIHDAKTQGNRAEFKRFILRRALAATDERAATAGGEATLPDGSDASWAISLAPTDLPDLHEVTLDITWSDRTSENLVIRAYRPEWSDAATRSVLLQKHRADYPPSRLATY